MGPNIQLQHNHKTNKVHMEMQGDYDNVPDRDEETHHPDKAHEAAHKMFKPAIDLIHKTDKKTTNEEVEQVDEKLSPFSTLGKVLTRSKLRGKENRFAYIAHSERPLTPDEQKERSKVRKVGTRLGIDVTEEVEQIDELDRKTRVSYLKKSLTQLNNIASSRHTSGNKTYGSKTVGKRLAGLSRLERSGAHPASVRDNIDKARARFEEVEQVDEAIRGYIQSEPGSGDGTAIRRPADQAERDQLAKNLSANRKYNAGKKIGKKSGSVRSNAAGMTSSQKISTALRSPDASKELGPKKFPYMPKNAKITPFLSKDVAEGSVPTTPKEKELAKHHGDPNRITFGDVIKARLKSAAAKKMGK